MALTFGVTIGLNPGAGHAASNYNHWDRLIPDMKQQGLTRLRFQLSWKNIELTQGVYTWGALDDAVQHCNQNNVVIVFVIREAPSWALANAAQRATDETGGNSPNNDGWYLPDPTLMAGFCQQVVNRYGPGSSIGVIDGYEIANEEMDIHNTSNSGGFHAINGSTYTGLYGSANQVITGANKIQPARNPLYFESVAAACYPVLKTTGKPVGMCAMWWVQPANPGGIPNTTVSNYYAFLDTLFAAGTLPQYADYLNFHYYSNKTSSLPSGGSNQCITYAAALSDIQSVINKYSSTLKVRCTEFGWQANTNTLSTTAVAGNGSATIFVDNPSGAAINIQMIVDSGANQETVTITGKSGSNLTGVFTKAHSGTYPVVILLDCDVPTQQIRFQDVLQRSSTSPIVEGLDYFTLNYDFSNGSSLVINNGDETYTYQPAFFTVQQFTGGPAATPIPIPHQDIIGESGGGGGTQGTPLYGDSTPIYNMAAMYRRAPKRGGLLESIGADIARLQGWIEDKFSDR